MDKFLLTLLIFFLMSEVAVAQSNELPAEVLRYVDQVGQIRTIEYSCLVCREYSGEDVPSWFPRKGELFVNFDIKAKHDLLALNYWEAKSFNALDNVGSMQSLDSFYNGRRKGYYKDDSPSVTGERATDGVVGPVGDKYAEELVFFGPEAGLGTTYCHRLQAGVDGLADLLAKKCQSFKKAGGIITAVDLFGLNSEISRFEVDLIFDSENRLTKFATYNYVFESKKRDFVSETKVHKFERCEGHWIPVEFETRVGSSESSFVFVDPASIRINRELSEADFAVEFPKTKYYFNLYEDKLMLNGAEVEKQRVELGKKTTHPWGYYGFLGAMFLCSVYIIYKRFLSG